MKFSSLIAIVLGTAVVTGWATRDADAQMKPQQDRPTLRDHGPRLQQMIERFDANGDGQLDDAERAAARAHAQEMRAERGRLGEGRRGHRLERPGHRGPTAERMRMRMLHRAVTAEQLRTGADRMEAREALRAKALERFDTNEDGALDRKERAAARQQMRENVRQRMLERFDANEDGTIDDAERKAAREIIREQRQERRNEMRQRMLDRFDTNTDGEIDEDERAAAREQFRGRVSDRLRPRPD